MCYDQNWRRSSSASVLTMSPSKSKLNAKPSFLKRNRHNSSDINSLNLNFDYPSLAHDILLLIRAIMNTEVREDSALCSLKYPCLFCFDLPLSLNTQHSLVMQLLEKATSRTLLCYEILFAVIIHLFNCLCCVQVGFTAVVEYQAALNHIAACLFDTQPK